MHEFLMDRQFFDGLLVSIQIGRNGVQRNILISQPLHDSFQVGTGNQGMLIVQLILLPLTHNTLDEQQQGDIELGAFERHDADIGLIVLKPIIARIKVECTLQKVKVARNLIVVQI